MTVHAELVDRFHETGFLSLGALSDATEVRWLIDVFDVLFGSGLADGSILDIAGPGDGTGARRLPQILRPENLVPELMDTGYRRRAKEWAQALLGVPDDELTWFGHMILKPACDGVETPWHQDEAYFDPRWRLRGLTVWMPLEDATVHNGCLHFAVGSHRQGVRPHRHIGGRRDIRGLEEVAPPHGRVVACPVPAGHATVHDVRTAHYAGPNRTDRPRRAYVHVFGTAAEPVTDPEPRPWLDPA